MTKGEQEFINQMTRKLMVDWCKQVLECGALDCYLPRIAEGGVPNPFVVYAMEKGWVSKDGKNILAAGWDTAARFLKR